MERKPIKIDITTISMGAVRKLFSTKRIAPRNDINTVAKVVPNIPPKIMETFLIAMFLTWKVLYKVFSLKDDGYLFCLPQT